LAVSRFRYSQRQDERIDLPIDRSLETEKREFAKNIVRPRSIDKEKSFSFMEDTFVL